MEKPIKKETVKVYNENEEKVTCFDKCESECLYEYKNENNEVYNIKGAEQFHNHKNIKIPKHNNGLPELDDVNYPSHYKLDGLDIESIDVLRAVLGDEGFKDFCLGNILNYAIRCKKKGQFDRDIRKIKSYSEFIISCQKDLNHDH